MREWLISNGEWGVALLMLVQNPFPVLPSEIIMPLAGFLASAGILDINGVVLAGLLGSLLAYGGYFLGRDYKLIAGYVHLFAWVLAACAALFTLWIWVRRHGKAERPA